jgi:serine/threonine protein kinase
VTLATGSRLGPYEILAPLGAGGMGEVYRARDPRLGREVALKVLPAAFSEDADRLRRFELEARAAGLLNHPGITAVFDIGSHDGASYVVSELLEGETLRSKLAGGALPVRKALDFARQIAHGLAAAHDKGIVHRDLKPENLFVTGDGRVKILDFGLAKVVHAELGSGGDSPTATAGTEPGMLLGTIGYMAPEQVRGKPADQRSDIFSFGAILHEMLSGQRAFRGDSAADTLSAILKEEPPELSALNSRVPPGLERVVRHCLEKSPGERFHSAHDLAFQLEAISDQSGSVPGTAVALRPSVSWKALASAAAGLGLGVLVGVLLARWSSRPPEPGEAPSLRYLTFSGDDWAPTASPDGKLVAFSSDRDGRDRIWLKELRSGSEVPLTSGSDGSAQFSPDGSAVFFMRSTGARNALYRVPVVGGEPRRLLEDLREYHPSPDGRRLAFIRTPHEDRNTAGDVWIANADGSDARRVSRLAGGWRLESPRWSPDGSRLAAVVQDPGASVTPPRLVAIDPATGSESPIAADIRGLVGRLAWEPSGRALLYTENEIISVADLSGRGRLIRLELASGHGRTLLTFPRPIGFGGLVVLPGGALLLDTDLSRQPLREAELRAGVASGPRFLTHGNAVDRQPVYSPDGERIVFSALRGDDYDLWELTPRTGSLRKLTDDPSHDWDPALTADGSRLVWSSNRSGHFEIWSAAADGSGPRQVSSDGVDAQNPTATPDGAWIVYASTNPTRAGVWKVRADGSQTTQLVADVSAIHPEVSPDGRHVLWFSETPGAGRTLHVQRVEDGQAVDFRIEGLSAWRARWLKGGKQIAFLHREGRNPLGIYVQDFVPGRDTTASRRRLAGFDSDRETESFGFSRDESRVALSQTEYGAALLLVEGVDGIGGPGGAPGAQASP